MRRLLVVFALAGCSAGPGIEARLAPFVGRSEAELVEGLGVPTRTHEVDGLRFLQYEQSRQVLHQVDPFWTRPYGRFSYPLTTPVLLTRSCEVTFTLRGGRVSAFVLRGDDCR